MTLDNLDKYSRIVIIGLGKSGMAAARFLSNLGLKIYVSESRPANQIENKELSELARLGIVVETGGHTKEIIKKNSLIVPSPGVSLNLPVLDYARGQNCTIAGELALAAGKIDVPVIAVTGTNGKTTVTSLIGELLQAGKKKVFVGGNIGTPVLDYLTTGEKADIVVIEVSSFQLDISGGFRPDIGLLLNVSSDHLDRHGTMESYSQAKLKIFANQTAEDIAIVNIDDNLINSDSITTPGTIYHFGLSKNSDARVLESQVIISTVINNHRIEEKYDLGKTRMLSLVNRLNSAAAILTARLIGTDKDIIDKVLHNFNPPSHRMENVKEINKVIYIDDSKATNIGAMEAALLGCSKPVVMIAGGRNKNGDFTTIRNAVKKHVKQLILIGEAKDEIATALETVTKIDKAENMAEAVRKAYVAAVPGDMVLLSPGCASFDMFSGYAERGRIFQEEVLSLEGRLKTTSKRNK